MRVFGKADEAGFHSSIIKLTQETSQQIERTYTRRSERTNEKKNDKRWEKITPTQQNKTEIQICAETKIVKKITGKKK